MLALFWACMPRFIGAELVLRLGGAVRLRRIAPACPAYRACLAGRQAFTTRPDTRGLKQAALSSAGFSVHQANPSHALILSLALTLSLSFSPSRSRSHTHTQHHFLSLTHSSDLFEKWAKNYLTIAILPLSIILAWMLTV